jgi:hypothetical protein
MNPIAPMPIGELNSALAASRRVRAEWLLSMDAGVLGVAELVSHATTEAGAPLRALHIAEVLRTQPGWGRRRTRVAMETLRRRLGVPETTPNHRLTVGWLTDRRSSGNRLTALCDQLTSDPRSAPSAGFPFTPVVPLPSGRLYQSSSPADTFETS